MENKNLKGFVAMGAATLVLCIGVGYASFSTGLQINAGANTKVAASNWDIHFENLSAAELTGTAAETSVPSIQDDTTIIETWEAILTTPGDSISYTFDVVNDGTFDAKVSGFNMPTPNCTGTGENATTDADNVCNNISYTLTYSDGTLVSDNDTLAAQDTKTMKLTLTYNDFTVDESGDNVEGAESLLPKNDVKLSNLGLVIPYVQD